MKTPREALSGILEVLDLLEIPYLIGGSVASSTHGISRPTLDVDFVVNLPAEKVKELAGLLAADLYADAPMMQEALMAGRSFNVIHYDSTYKFDFFPLRATAEDIILRKLL